MASSSAVAGSLGKAVAREFKTNAWAPKSAIVTGDLSALSKAPIDWRSAWASLQREAALATASLAALSSCESIVLMTISYSDPSTGSIVRFLMLTRKA